MGEYVYKTTPRLIQPHVSIRLDEDGDIIQRAVAGYVYAYKPSFNTDNNRKMQARYVAPALRAFHTRGIEIPHWGAALDKKAKGLKVGDRVFRTRGTVSVSDYDFDRVGVIINLDGSDEDKRTLAQVLDPAHYGINNAALANYIGTILVHDYGWGVVFPNEYAEDLVKWKAKLDPNYRELFERLEHVTDGGTTGIARARALSNLNLNLRG